MGALPQEGSLLLIKTVRNVHLATRSIFDLRNLKWYNRLEKKRNMLTRMSPSVDPFQRR